MRFRILLPLFLLAASIAAFAQAPTQVLVAPAPSAADYERFAREVEGSLQRDIIAPWFPRAVDARGGFQQNYSNTWEKQPGDERSVVYQSRLTWLASQTAMRDAARRTEFQSHARHGLRFLAERGWDAQNGGFFWEVDPSGKPSAERADEKHVYGIAFGIYAASAAHAATKDRAALDLAQRAFRWLEANAHDKRNGGYFEALTRTGKPILAPRGQRDASGAEVTRDCIGTRYGFKSMNTHIHLLEAFTELYSEWRDPLLRRRLLEVLGLVRDRITVPEVGAMHLYFLPNWTPVPDHDSYGHDVETAFLIVEAAGALGFPDDARTWSVARRLVDHALEAGWDAEHGGFFDAGGIYNAVFNDEKVWWVQAEGLNALLLMHEKFGARDPKYWAAWQKQWAFIRDKQIDRTSGGWFTYVTRDGSTVKSTSKSNAWQDGYHQGRALMHVADGLRKLARR